MSRRSWCFATDQRHETDGQLRSGSRTSAVAFASESPHRMLAGGDLVACADVGVGCDPSISFKNAQNLIYLVGKRVPCSHDVGVVITQEHECGLFAERSLIHSAFSSIAMRRSASRLSRSWGSRWQVCRQSR